LWDDLKIIEGYRCQKKLKRYIFILQVLNCRIQREILNKMFFSYSSELDGLHAAGIHDFSFVRKGSHVVPTGFMYPQKTAYFQFIGFYYMLHFDIIVKNENRPKIIYFLKYI